MGAAGGIGVLRCAQDDSQKRTAARAAVEGAAKATAEITVEPNKGNGKTKQIRRGPSGSGKL
jgi:hypothetical protein